MSDEGAKTGYRPCPNCGQPYHREFGHLTRDYGITRAELDCLAALRSDAERDGAAPKRKAS